MPSMRPALLPVGLIAAVAVTALGAPARAQGIMYTRDVRVVVSSDYVFRGVQRAEETFKLVGELRFNGLHGGAALIQPFDDDFASETRLFGGWSPHLEDHGSMFDFELGFTWYATPDSAPGFPDDSRFEPYAKLFLDAPLMPSLASYYDTELETYTLEGRLTHFVPLGAQNGVELGFDGGLVSPDDADEHAYAHGSIDLVRNFLGGVEGFVGVRGATSSEDLYFDSVGPFGPVYDQRGRVWATAGFSATF
jgi:hypothetical protein